MIAPRAATFMLITVAALVSACATGGARAPEKTLEQRTQECEARGGVLSPTSRMTGRDALDYVCRITGGPSERLRGT